MAKYHPRVVTTPKEYFLNPQSISQKKYEALREFFCEDTSAALVAKKFGYTKGTVYSLARDFRKTLKSAVEEDPFFQTKKMGRQEKDQDGKIFDIIIALCITELEKFKKKKFDWLGNRKLVFSAGSSS